MAYRILKNAGYLPRKLELRSEISDLEPLVAADEELPSRARAYQRLNYVRAQLQIGRGHRADLRVEQAYYQRLLDRFHK